MANYVARLKDDLVEQFRDKKNIEALVEVVGMELQEVFDVLKAMPEGRDVYTAKGKQLDGVGDIAVLSRMEAGKLSGNPIPFDILDDETYRQFLIYKILKNTCDCTYPDIIKAFRMFWDRPIYYSEDPEQPATMIFDTGEMQGNVDTRPLFNTPLLRAAGITLKLYARTSTPMETCRIGIISGLGYAVTETDLPVVERDYHFRDELKIGSQYHTVTEDRIPVLERDYNFGFKLSLGSGNYTVAHDTLPPVERSYQLNADIDAGSSVHSIMETPISGVVLKK